MHVFSPIAVVVPRTSARRTRAVTSRCLRQGSASEIRRRCPGLLLLSFDHRLDDDVDATIARLIDIVGGADQRLALSAPFGANAVARPTLARQIGGHRIGPALRQAHVVFVTAGRVGMADAMNDRLFIDLENARSEGGSVGKE